MKTKIKHTKNKDFNLWKWIKYWLSPHCPNCGGILKAKMLDSEVDKLVYICSECKEEFI